MLSDDAKASKNRILSPGTKRLSG